MSTNEGLLREEEMAFELNNKTISELTNNSKNLIKNLFGVLDENSLVECYRLDDSSKTDLVISYNGQKHYVSMKSGAAVIVHNEILDNFINYLRSEGISERTIKTIRLFHYGDGTEDGTGMNRQSYQDIVYQLKDEIALANIELNKRTDFVVRVVERLVFKGSNDSFQEADSFYFGDRNFGVVVTKNQIIKHLYRKNFDYYNNLHIGPLLLRPDCRYAGKAIRSERKRNRIVAYWPNLQSDISYISRRYNYDYATFK